VGDVRRFCPAKIGDHDVIVLSSFASTHTSILTGQMSCHPAMPPKVPFIAGSDPSIALDLSIVLEMGKEGTEKLSD
jgi:hypothetical protein